MNEDAHLVYHPGRHRGGSTGSWSKLLPFSRNHAYCIALADVEIMTFLEELRQKSWIHFET